MAGVIERLREQFAAMSYFARDMASFVRDLSNPSHIVGYYLGVAERGYKPQIVQNGIKQIDKAIARGHVLAPSQRELLMHLRKDAPRVRMNDQSGPEALSVLAVQMGDEGRKAFLNFCKHYNMHEEGARILDMLITHPDKARSEVFRTPEFLVFAEDVFRGAEQDRADRQLTNHDDLGRCRERVIGFLHRAQGVDEGSRPEGPG